MTMEHFNYTIFRQMVHEGGKVASSTVTSTPQGRSRVLISVRG